MKELLGIVYISKATTSFGIDELEALSEQASVANKKIEVTGYLYYEHNHFLQYIEGFQNTTQFLMDHIEKDDRHQVIHSIPFKNILSRKFPTWHMKNISRNMLCEINMETILIDYIKMINHNLYKKTNKSGKNVRDMIDKIAYFQNILK